MSAKSKSKESASEHELMQAEIEQLNDKLCASEDDNKKLLRGQALMASNISKLTGLLEEAVAQLGKTNDEYHSDLRDKIIKEIGE